MKCFVCNADAPDAKWLTNHTACEKCYKEYLLWLENRYAKEVLRKHIQKKP